MTCIHSTPDGAGGYHCGPGGRHAGHNVSAGVCRACQGLPASPPAPNVAPPPPDPWPAVVEDIIAHGDDAWIERLNLCRNFVAQAEFVQKPCRAATHKRVLMEAWKCRAR